MDDGRNYIVDTDSIRNDKINGNCDGYGCGIRHIILPTDRRIKRLYKILHAKRNDTKTVQALSCGSLSNNQ